MQSVSELTELIDIYAGSVGLSRSSPLGVAGGEGEQGIRWEAPYAQLMLWRIQSTGKALIRAEVEKAQEILDVLLISAEKNLSGVVDGYLLLFLGKEPDEGLILRFEALNWTPMSAERALSGLWKEILQKPDGNDYGARRSSVFLNPPHPGGWLRCRNSRSHTRRYGGRSAGAAVRTQRGKSSWSADDGENGANSTDGFPGSAE
jgi:hypothetical protein